MRSTQLPKNVREYIMVLSFVHSFSKWVIYSQNQSPQKMENNTPNLNFSLWMEPLLLWKMWIQPSFFSEHFWWNMLVWASFCYMVYSNGVAHQTVVPVNLPELIDPCRKTDFSSLFKELMTQKQFLHHFPQLDLAHMVVSLMWNNFLCQRNNYLLVWSMSLQLSQKSIVSWKCWT